MLMPDAATTDYRFLLANERTFLAYVRTALSLQLTGLAVVRFLTTQPRWVGTALGVVLVISGSLTVWGAYLRWRANEASIRANTEMDTARSPLPLVCAVAGLPFAVGLVLIFFA